MKKLKKISTRGIFVITKSPEQYNDEFNTEEKIREIRACGSSIVVFDDVLYYNQKAKDLFFI